MKQLSKGEAFRELTNWSQRSSVGFTFARSDAAIHFSLRKTTLKVHEPNHLLLEAKGSFNTQLFCADDAGFSFVTAKEFASEFSGAGKITPPFETALCVLFPDRDFCLIFPEAE
jgi:hypothetical protein